MPSIADIKSAIDSFLEVSESFASMIAILSLATSIVAAVNSLRSNAKDTAPEVPPPLNPFPAVTAVISPTVGVAQDGTPEARVKTCPSEPFASLANVVVPEAYITSPDE